jgi:hypothetical protein
MRTTASDIKYTANLTTYQDIPYLACQMHDESGLHQLGRVVKRIIMEFNGFLSRHALGDEQTSSRRVWQLRMWRLINLFATVAGFCRRVFVRVHDHATRTAPALCAKHHITRGREEIGAKPPSFLSLVREALNH